MVIYFLLGERWQRIQLDSLVSFVYLWTDTSGASVAFSAYQGESSQLQLLAFKLFSLWNSGKIYKTHQVTLRTFCLSYQWGRRIDTTLSTEIMCIYKPLQLLLYCTLQVGDVLVCKSVRIFQTSLNIVYYLFQDMRDLWQNPETKESHLTFCYICPWYPCKTKLSVSKSPCCSCYL